MRARINASTHLRINEPRAARISGKIERKFHLDYAKQSQFTKCPNGRKVNMYKGLQQRLLSDVCQKQSQTESISWPQGPRLGLAEDGKRQGAVRHLQSEKWNVCRGPSDIYYRTMRKTRDQIYDELLVIKCQQGDKEALNELVGRWQKRLWNYAFKVAGSESAAWDIVQETWHGIIKGIRKLDDVAVFPRWAFRIANNKCTDWLRKRQSQSRLNDQLVEQTSRTPTTETNKEEEAEILHKAIAELAPDRKALIMLRYKEDFAIGQIAEILSVPEGTVKSRLHRTLNELRQLVERD